MPDTDDDLDESGLNPAERRILQAKADRAEELEAQLKEATWKLATSGLDLSDEKRDALQAVHKGDMTPEAIRETASRLGFAEPVAQQPDVPVGDLAAQQRIVDAAGGAHTRPPSAEADLEARIAAANTPEELMAVYRESGRPIAL